MFDTYSTLLYDLGDERYMVTSPIPATITRGEHRAQYEDYIESDFTVEWPEMDIMGYGSTKDHAISDFRKRVISQFNEIVGAPFDKIDVDTPEFRILRHCVTDLRP